MLDLATHAITTPHFPWIHSFVPLWRSLCPFSPLCIQPSIWSLQSPGHIAVLSLLYIRTDGMMPLFPWANPSCALTLDHCWPGFPTESAYTVRLYLCVCYVLISGSWLFQKSFCHGYFKSKYCFAECMGKEGMAVTQQPMHHTACISFNKAFLCAPFIQGEWHSPVTLLSMIRFYPN